MKVILIPLFLCVALGVWGNPPTISELEAELANNPNNPLTLYNLGLLYYLNEQFSEAIEPWEKLKSLEPDDWQLRTKLIQAYSASGKLEERENEIRELHTLRGSEKIPELSEATFFIRDQFHVENVKVFAIDYYDMDAGWRMGPLVWRFLLSKDGETLDWFISVGSYDVTTELMRAAGEIGKDERAYHLDGYWDSGRHQTYGIFKKKPDYDWVRKRVIEIISGNLNATSSFNP